jgi:hypothetical protein
MKIIIVSSFVFISSLLTNFQALAMFDTGMDFLERAQLTVNFQNSEGLSQKATEDLQALFSKFQFAIANDTKVIAPMKISGTQSRPILTIGIRKCVAFICESAFIDAEITMRPVSGKCDRNWMMEMDLARSGDNVREIYSRILIPTCYINHPNNNGGYLTFEGWAEHGPKYDTGIKQRTMMKFLKNQVQPMVKALDERLKDLARGI